MEIIHPRPYSCLSVSGCLQRKSPPVRTLWRSFLGATPVGIWHLLAPAASKPTGRKAGGGAPVAIRPVGRRERPVIRHPGDTFCTASPTGQPERRHRRRERDLRLPRGELVRPFVARQRDISAIQSRARSTSAPRTVGGTAPTICSSPRKTATVSLGFMVPLYGRPFSTATGENPRVAAFGPALSAAEPSWSCNPSSWSPSGFSGPAEPSAARVEAAYGCPQ